MALSDSGLVVRYYIDEATSGQGPANVLDAGPSPAYDLPITYDSTNLNYEETGSNSGLECDATDGDQRADEVIEDTSGDKIRDDFRGQQTYTAELVVRVDDFSASNGRVFAINVSGNNPDFGITGTSGTVMRFYWEETLMRTIDPGTARAVWHIVIDTTEATANDRIKMYKDKVLQSPTVNANPAQNDTLIWANARRFFLFNRGTASFDRSMDGELSYLALYTEAFDQTRIDDHFDVLDPDDDTPSAADVPYQPWMQRAPILAQ